MKIHEVQNNPNANLSGSVKNIKFIEASKVDDNKGSNFANPLVNIKNLGKYYTVKSTSHKATIGAPSR